MKVHFETTPFFCKYVDLVNDYQSPHYVLRVVIYVPYFECSQLWTSFSASRETSGPYSDTKVTVKFFNKSK